MELSIQTKDIHLKASLLEEEARRKILEDESIDAEELERLEALERKDYYKYTHELTRVDHNENCKGFLENLGITISKE